jgi:hypothetical protein
LEKVQLQPAMPSNLELTILDSGRKGVAIGGVDLSMGIARFITEWPDDWISSKTGFVAIFYAFGKLILTVASYTL